MFLQQLNPRFTDAERENCIPVIRRMVELAHIVRRGSILALERELSEEQSVFLKSGIQLLLYAVSPERVEYFLQKLILAGNYSNSQLLERLIMMEGILDISQGFPPVHVAFNLLAVMGEEYVARIKEIFPDEDEVSRHLSPYLF